MPSDNSPSPGSGLPPAAKPAKGLSDPYALAMELPVLIVGCILVGGVFGFFLDRWLHSKPVLMIVLGLLGFAAGVREVLRRLPSK